MHSSPLHPSDVIPCVFVLYCSLGKKCCQEVSALDFESTFRYKDSQWLHLFGAGDGNWSRCFNPQG